MNTNKWIIEDWMSNHCYTNKTFNSFEEARDFISQVASEEAGDNEELYNGICDDLYAVEVTSE